MQGNEDLQTFRALPERARVCGIVAGCIIHTRTTRRQSWKYPDQTELIIVPKLDRPLFGRAPVTDSVPACVFRSPMCGFLNFFFFIFLFQLEHYFFPLFLYLVSFLERNVLVLLDIPRLSASVLLCTYW